MEFGLKIKADNTAIDEPTLALMLEEANWERPTLNPPQAWNSIMPKNWRNLCTRHIHLLTGLPKNLAKTWIRWRSSKGPSSPLSAPPLLHSKRTPCFQGLDRQKLASLYQRIGSLKYFDFRGPIVWANLSTKPLQLSSSYNEQHLKLGKGDFFVSYFLGILAPKSLHPDDFSIAKLNCEFLNTAFMLLKQGSIQK